MNRIIISFYLFSLLLLFPKNLNASHWGSNNDSLNVDQASQLNLPKYFYKRFEGTINHKTKIVMNLIRRDKFLTGTYYFVSNGRPITFTHKSKINNDGKFYLIGTSDQYDIEFIPVNSGGEFIGSFTNNHLIVGTWKKQKSAKRYNFNLVESYPAGCIEMEMKNLFNNYYYKKNKDATIDFYFAQINKYFDKKIEETINSCITDSLIKSCGFQDSTNSFNSFEALMNNFLEQYKNDEVKFKSPDSDYIRRWENYYSDLILLNTKDILSIENIGYYDCGGAHSSATYIFRNYNIKTGKEITLNELFKPNYNNALDKIGWNIFYETYKNQNPPGFDIDTFHLNNNFAITQNGLLFKYQEYEISSYSFGAPEVFIPFSKIRKIIKPDGLLAQFLH